MAISLAKAEDTGIIKNKPFCACLDTIPGISDCLKWR
ncbi:hypothetical protein HMPREF0866_04525 [Ruminococcaceae bacterium D16]|nr:hypothetical protein HMPREF0866_04525 [Ruminococcaceae bacterium D16]